MRKCGRLFLILLLPAFFTGLSSATDVSPNYPEAVQLAIEHADNPAGWQAPSLFVIPDSPGGAEVLRYENGNLIVRTATKSSYFKWNYVNQPGYKIYGPPTSAATWVTTGNDVTRFLRANGVSGTNVTTLLERGLGMDSTGTHDAIVELAVNTQHLMRPTRNPDISQYLPDAYGNNAPFVKPGGMSDEAFTHFTAYYNTWLADAYGGYSFPWTQLGYTFFWGNGNTLDRIIGMSEFILLGGSPADIVGIYATPSYIYTGNDGTGFSSAAEASYGNGFAGFKIDGPCDTLWAGHRFQKNVSNEAANPNRVLIEKDALVAGAQGLLIWSLNYDVVNDGTIGGATADKYGIPGTSNIAVFFKADTGTDYGTPIINGINRLTNTGIISSPGTAIRAEAGNTHITNDAGGVIIGGAYAVQTGAGEDTLIVNGGEITGKIDLGEGRDILSVTDHGNARFNLTLNRDTASTAHMTHVETVTIANNTCLALSVTGTGNIKNNERFLLVETETLNADPAKLIILDDPALPMLSFFADKTENRLSLVALRNATYYGQRSGNASLGALIDDLANTATDHDMAGVIDALDRSGDSRNARAFEPANTPAMVQTGFGTLGRFTRAVTSHMDDLRARRTERGGSTGILQDDGSFGQGVWGQGLGAELHQDSRGGTGGYSATLWGSALGYDRFLYDHLLLGGGGGYARNKIRSRDIDTRTDTDITPVHVYASLDRDACYLDAMVLFSYNRYASRRHIAFEGLDRVAKADYSGRQYSGYLEGGYLFEKGGIWVTPFTSLQYMHLHIDGYSETGAEALNLHIAGQNHSLLQTGLGAKLAFPIRHGALRVIPELHAKWLYDVAGDLEETRSRFAGGGAPFITKGLEPGPSAIEVGTRLILMSQSGATFSLNYNFEKKSGFHGHTGYLDVRYAY